MPEILWLARYRQSTKVPGAPLERLSLQQALDLSLQSDLVSIVDRLMPESTGRCACCDLRPQGTPRQWLMCLMPVQ